MLAIFSNMASGILAVLGEDAFFNGATTATKVNIEHGVQLAGLGAASAQRDADMVYVHDIASVAASAGARMGDTFVLNGSTYRLEHPVDRNGAIDRFVVIKVG